MEEQCWTFCLKTVIAKVIFFEIELYDSVENCIVIVRPTQHEDTQGSCLHLCHRHSPWCHTFGFSSMTFEGIHHIHSKFI